MAVVASRAQGHKDSGAGDPTLVTDTGRAEAMIGRYYRAPISSAHDRHLEGREALGNVYVDGPTLARYEAPGRAD